MKRLDIVTVVPLAVLGIGSLLFVPTAGVRAAEPTPKVRPAEAKLGVQPDGHLSPAAFDFVKPGAARSEVDSRLGEPYVSSSSVVVKGEIDLFVDEMPTGPSTRAPQPTEDVHYYEYRPRAHSSEFARIVFRQDKVWYAMLPPRPSERIREQIFSRYGNVFEEERIHRRSGHILMVEVILWLEKQGLGFVEKPGRGITHRIVFPPGSDLRQGR